jgi:L-alanine-DL-glutamate epimerase-like enolase superfamily enzyme
MTRGAARLRTPESTGRGRETSPAPSSTYARVAQLPLTIERCELLPLVRDTSSGFTKISIVVRLTGHGHTGEGEDITWDQIDQVEFLREAGPLSWLRGMRTFDEFSTLVGLAELFPVEPIRDSARFYRRWAFESAALDLALRQNGLSLQDAVARTPRPVRFVASVRLGDPPSLAPLTARRGVDPDLRFKLDPTAGWDDGLVSELARLGCVEVVDMKGRYTNATVAMDPDPQLYRRVFDGLPGAWIEDPGVSGDTIELLERHRDRITWDEPVHSVADIEALPWPPRMLNIKPARFGNVRSLFDTYDYCEAHGIGAYGGGMFEQGPGRGQLQYLASLFHADGPNDLAPSGYNLQLPERDLPRSPLAPKPHDTGFRWGTYDRRRTIRERLPEAWSEEGALSV